MCRRTFLLMAVSGLLAYSQAATPYNFWDPGLNTQTVRTSYDSINAGTIYGPITVPSIRSLNPSFETPQFASQQYCPTGSGIAWTFNCSAGIQHNGSAWGAANAPEGVQTAFLQNLGSASQTINLAAGSYAASFWAARRGSQLQPVRVTIDGQQIGSLVQPQSSSFGPFSIPFTISTGGNHTIGFAGTDGSTDKTIFIDAFCVPGISLNFYPCVIDSALITTISGTEGAFPTGPTTYGSVSNAWWKNYNWGYGNFWVLSINNEAGFRNCNSGPPNLSVPRSSPGSGIYGFDVIMDTHGGEYFNRAHLVMNLDAAANPCPIGSNIPFMAFGAQSNRGNGGPVGQLNTASGHTLSFVAKLWAYNTMRYSANPTVGGALMELFATAEWPDQYGRTRQRMLFVYLFADNISSSTPAHVHWNWPASEAMWSNGADIAVFYLGQAQSLCGVNIPTVQSTDTYYAINLQTLFQCASNLGKFDNAMPTGYSLPITGVHWANEAAADYGALWTSVHGMNMQ